VQLLDWVTLIVYTFTGAVACFGGQTAPPASARVVSVAAFDGTVEDTAASVLGQFHTPGGIISSRSTCDAVSRHHLQAGQLTLAAALDSVLVPHGYKWVGSARGVVVMQPGDTPGLLNTIISNVRIDLNERPELAMQTILAAPEIHRRILAAGWVQDTPTIGFAALPKQRSDDVSAAAMLATFRGRTLLEVLSAAAGQIGGVWLYEQYLCGGKTHIRLSWVSLPARQRAQASR
jgi:hypothetical protein